ncbi:MAG: DUF4845 domain-containing protein [Pseudomonadales bacterium]|nr:DUF4845 domain-containing protein [Pseudomonadales bacterium]
MSSMKIQRRKLQRGMSKYAMLLVLMALVVFGTAALRLGPHYIDFTVMQGIIERLPTQIHKDMSKTKIREHFAKQFRIENFSQNVREVVKIDRNRERTVVAVEYEIREHLFYNIDVVLAFSESRTFN